MNQDAVNKSVILVMAFAISALFLTMVHQFLMALFLAGLFSALARPLFLRLQRLVGGRRRLASVLTLLLMAVVVLIPLVFLIVVLVGQALDVSQIITVWFRAFIAEPSVFEDYLRQLPLYDQVMQHRAQIVAQAGEAATVVSRLLVDWVSSVTLGTANFIFMGFVLLYSMYFLQLDGPTLIQKILYYLPLKTDEERMMLDKFTSVTRATLRGSLLIGLLQGSLAGIAFAVVGIPNAVFWGSVMAVLSTIPNIGAALVWIPAAVILAAQGHLLAGIGLGLFCGLVVGSLDNVLRPILVGKDTKMHELLIFFSTLGGIFMFGLAGVFIGPVIASLFVSIWEMYGVEFAEVLPDVDAAMLGFHPDQTASDEETGGPIAGDDSTGSSDDGADTTDDESSSGGS